MNRYVVITGASKGIGRATALHLDSLGFHVFAGVRKAQDADQLRSAASERLTPVLLDITNSTHIEQVVEEVTKRAGKEGIAGLVNNAGIALAAPLEFIPVAEFRQQIEVNLIGQLAVTQAFIPLLRAQPGRIINISSIGGRLASPMIGAYHASKFALEALTDSLRLELHPWGIDAISIQPGTIATPIWETSVHKANEMMAGMPAEMRVLYGPQIDKAQASAAVSAKNGIAPERVAAVIGHALTTRRPRTRYLVGPDAKIAARAVVPLPDRVRDRLILAR
ncbi:MAG: SDR family NAD(P)-dependent oxidoreductase [Anaerolineae bacterium]